MERERPLQLAHGLLVGDFQKVRRHASRAGIAHQVVKRGAHLHRVLRVAAGRIEESVDARVVDRHFFRGELRAEVFEPVVGIDAEAVTARIRQVERHGEAVERVPLRAEELLEDALFRAEERVAHAAVRLEPCAHDVKDSWPEPARGLELVEDHHDTLARALREALREIERPFEETLRVRLASELQRELHVLVLHLDRWLHPRGDRLGLLEAALHTGEVLQNGVGQTLAQPADVGGTETVDIRGVGAVPAQPAQRLDDDRRLSDAPWAGDEDVLAILEPLGEPTEVRLATDEVGRRYRTSDGEVRRCERPVARSQHLGRSIHRMYQSHSLDGYRGRRGTMGACPISSPRSSLPLRRWPAGSRDRSRPIRRRGASSQTR